MKGSQDCGWCTRRPWPRVWGRDTAWGQMPPAPSVPNRRQPRRPRSVDRHKFAAKPEVHQQPRHQLEQRRDGSRRRSGSRLRSPNERRPTSWIAYPPARPRQSSLRRTSSRCSSSGRNSHGGRRPVEARISGLPQAEPLVTCGGDRESERSVARASPVSHGVAVDRPVRERTDGVDGSRRSRGAPAATLALRDAFSDRTSSAAPDSSYSTCGSTTEKRESRAAPGSPAVAAGARGEDELELGKRTAPIRARPLRGIRACHHVLVRPRSPTRPDSSPGAAPRRPRGWCPDHLAARPRQRSRPRAHRHERPEVDEVDELAVNGLHSCRPSGDRRARPRSS